MTQTAIEPRLSAMASPNVRSSKKQWRLHLALIYLALFSVMVLLLSSTKSPLRRVRQLRFLKTTSLIDVRYRDLLRVLPPDPKLGYISDLVPAGASLAQFCEFYYQAQYALAPRVLELSSRPRYVVANLVDPSRLEALCRLHSLRPIAVFPHGVTFLEHRPEP